MSRKEAVGIPAPPNVRRLPEMPRWKIVQNGMSVSELSWRLVIDWLPWEIKVKVLQNGVREICYTIPAETPAMKRTLNITRSENERDGDAPIVKK